MSALIEHLARGQAAVGQGTIAGLVNANGAPGTPSSAITVQTVNTDTPNPFFTWQSTITFTGTANVTQILKGRLSQEHAWMTLDSHAVSGTNGDILTRAATVIKCAEYCSEVTVMSAANATCLATILT